MLWMLKGWMFPPSKNLWSHCVHADANGEKRQHSCTPESVLVFHVHHNQALKNAY